MKLPVISIVGRPNVGKSSLLNCLAEERISIVEHTPGVTRDRITTVVFHNDVALEIQDTGGIGIIDQDELEADIERQINMALHGADMIVLVVDVQDGLVPLDRDVAARLRENKVLQERKIPILLVANKVDDGRFDDYVNDFYALGLGEPLAMSALVGFGRNELLDKVCETLPPNIHEAVEPVMKVAVVGRQNVGKSTFVNALAQEERVIVSEIPGTTRDAVDVRFEKDGRNFIIIDTAGLQRKTRVKDSIEFYSQVRTEAAIRRSDIVLFLIDASKEITRVDKKLSESIATQAKATVVVINKWDLTNQAVETERYAEYLTDRMPGLTFSPMVFTTAKEGRNIQSVVDLAQHLFKLSKTRVGTGELNRVVEKVTKQHFPAKVGGKIPKIYYCTQVGTVPPSFVFFVNNPKYFTKGYRRYVENCMREDLPFREIPLRIFFRKRESIYKNDKGK